MKSIIDFVVEKLKIDKNIKNYIQSDNKSELIPEEIEALENFFKDNVKNIDEINTSRGKFSIIFDKSLKTTQRQSVRLVVTKPPRSNGGYNIALYKADRWMVQNIGGKDKKKGINEPLLANIDEVIEKLEKNFLKGKWAEDLGAKLKNK